MASKKLKNLLGLISNNEDSAKKNKKKSKAKPKAEPKLDYLDEETPGLVPINRYPTPFEITGTGVLFPDGSLQTSAQGGSAIIDPGLSAQVQQNTSDIAKNAADIAAIEIPEAPENPDNPDPIDAYTKAEVDATQAAQDVMIAKNAADIAAIEIPEAPENPDPIDAYTKAEIDVSQAAQDETIDLKAPQDTTYTKAEVDATQDAQDETIALKAPQANTYTKGEVNFSQGEQDVQIASKAPQETTYTKDEVDASQGAQDTKIAKNLTDIAKNKSDIASNSAAIGGLSTRMTSSENDIIELEEEIEALAPSFDRGHWEHDPVTGMAARAPIEGAYYLSDKNALITQMFGETEQIYFHNIDSEEPPQTHTFADVQPGMYVEMFEGLDSSFLLGVVETVTEGTTHTIVDVTVVKAEGGPGEEDDTAVSGQSVKAGVRVKFFSLAEGELNLDGYMQTSGGTFTGLVKHKKEIVIEPTLPSRFVNIKNRYATNADGTNSGGSDNTQFGVNFDLDHGNSGYNTVKWSTRNGNILAVYGGTQANAKYTGVITDGTHLVNKAYVDNSIPPILHTLTSYGSSIQYVPLKSLVSGEFSATSPDMSSNKDFYFWKMYDLKGSQTYAQDFEVTPSTMLEIWKGGSLIVKTGIKEWAVYDGADVKATISGNKPIAQSQNLNSNDRYGIIISGLAKKSSATRELRDKVLDKTKRVDKKRNK